MKTVSMKALRDFPYAGHRIKAGQVPAFQRTGTGKGVRYEWYRPDVERWIANQRRTLRRSA